MKLSALIIFLSVVLIIYTAINYYIFIRGWQAISGMQNIKTYYLVFFLILSLSYIVGRFGERIFVSHFTDVFIWIGSFWIAAMMYFFLIVLFIDIIRLLNHIIPFLPSLILTQYAATKLWVFSCSLVFVISLVIYGSINARNIKIQTLDIKLNKSLEEPLNIVMLSDVHLGTIINRNRLRNIVEKINALNPDIVLFVGDIVDEDIKPVIRFNLGEMLLNIKAKYGVYAINGNHEYIGGVEKADKYLSSHGITMLRDTNVLINNSFFICGREDRDSERFSGKKRKELKELISGLDHNKILIVLNHQPTKLYEAVEQGVDLHLSGHTHHGQLFPFNFVTDKIYEISHGYKKTENTNFYVSSGVGSWGPPVRIGNHPEIVNIRLLGKED